MKCLITFFSLLTIFTVMVSFPKLTLAQTTPAPLTGIRNPVIGDLGGNTETSQTEAQDGTLFLRQFINLWRNAINVGAILLIVCYLWGGFEWITAGGDSGKLEKARTRILHATIGMLILAASFIIIGFLSYGLFGENFDLLNLDFLTPGS